MPYMMQANGDRTCVYKQGADGKPDGEPLHCYTGPDAEAQCKDYMKALYANEPTQASDQSMNLFSFTELSANVELKAIDGLAAGTFISGRGEEVTFPAEDLQAYIDNTNKIIESTRTASGEIVGLPIDMDGHDHKGGAGWIKGLQLDKARNIIQFMVEWTQQGAQVIKDNIRRFFSPSIDPNNKVIFGGSLTNWPATRDNNTGQILLRPVELSQSIKEIDMPKTFEEMFVDLKAGILEAVGRKPAESQAAPPPVPAELDGGNSPTIKELLGTPEAIELLGQKAQELAQDAIRTEKRKLHAVEFAARIAGGTKERPFGLAVRPNEIVALLLSLPEKQALAVEKILDRSLTAAVDFAQYGFDSDGYIQKPALDPKVRELAQTWVKAGRTIQEFFSVNPELGNPENFDLKEFTIKKEG